MNTIASSIIAIFGGGFAGSMIWLCLFAVFDPIMFPKDQPRDQSTIANATLYSALFGAALGLILVLGSGQRL